MRNNLPNTWPPKRDLYFPETVPLGWLDVREGLESTGPYEEVDSDWDPFIGDFSWRRFGAAHGTLTIPAGLEARLRINQQAAYDLSPLARLQPNGVQVLDLRLKPVTDEQLIHIAGWNSLHTLSLSGAKITGHSLRHLHGLTGLRHLSFTPISWPLDPSRTHTPIDDEMVAIKELGNLETLYLTVNQLAGHGITYLQSLPRLRTLRLSIAQGWGPQGWKAIGKLRGLRRLDLGGTSLSSTNLDSIGNLADLRELNLIRTWYKDSLGFVPALRQLRAIYISHTQIADAELAHLAELPELRKVDYSANRVGNEGIKHLAAIPALNDLDLSTYDSGFPPTITVQSCRLLSQSRHLEKLDLSGTKLDEQGLVYIGQLFALQELRLERTGTSDTGLAYLANLNKLRVLNLWQTSISDNGLPYLGGIKNLEELELVATKVHGPGLIHLQGLVNLKKLSFGGTAEFQGRQLSRLSELTNLEDLYLEGEGIRDEDLHHLPGYIHLQRLALTSTSISDKLLAELSQFMHVRMLDLSRTSIGDAGVTYLGRLTSLEDLDLSRTNITDAGLRSLEQLNGLERLNLLGTSATQAGIARFKSALPNCEISG